MLHARRHEPRSYPTLNVAGDFSSICTEDLLQLTHLNAHGVLGQCRQHPWFTMHLPRYLAVMQADTVATASSIDSELVSEVAALGFDREFIIESIRHRVQVCRVPPRTPSATCIRVGVRQAASCGEHESTHRRRL